MVRVLFVCLGNICRSPMAEGLLLKQIREAGMEEVIEVDSAGTSAWHEGEAPDRRMRELAHHRDVHLPSRARQVREKDAVEFDYVIPMDEQNYREVQALFQGVPNAKAEVIKMRAFDPEAPEADVPDPYFGGTQGFERVYDILERSTGNFLQHLREANNL